MTDYLGHKPQDWERSYMRSRLDGSGDNKDMWDALSNPQNYTTDRPNMDAEAAFSVGSMKGAGRDGLVAGPSTAYYKVEQPAEPTSTPAPAAEAPVAEEVNSTSAYLLSQRAAEANAGVAAYEQFLNKQGDAAINNNPAPEQAFKNAYQANLTEELKAQAPTTLAVKKAEIELADKQKANMQNNFELNLSPSSSSAQQQSGMLFT